MIDHVETPANYIAHALRNPASIETHYYRAMLLKHFDTMGESAGSVFGSFYQAALEQPRLKSTFYSAVNSAFKGLQPGSRSVARRWLNVMEGMVVLATVDDTLTTYIARDLLGKLPSLVGRQASGAEYQAASDILTATGRQSKFAALIPQSLVHQVIKWHVQMMGNDFVRAAEKVTELRMVPVFMPELAKIENTKGIHVHAEGRDDDPDTTIVLAFHRAGNGFELFDIPHQRNGHRFQPRALSLDEVSGGEIGEQIRYRLEQIAGDPMPHQDWVPPIAEAVYCRMN